MESIKSQVEQKKKKKKKTGQKEKYKKIENGSDQRKGNGRKCKR